MQFFLRFYLSEALSAIYIYIYIYVYIYIYAYGNILGAERIARVEGDSSPQLLLRKTSDLVSLGFWVKGWGIRV